MTQSHELGSSEYSQQQAGAWLGGYSSTSGPMIKHFGLRALEQSILGLAQPIIYVNKKSFAASTPMTGAREPLTYAAPLSSPQDPSQRWSLAFVSDTARCGFYRTQLDAVSICDR